MYFKVLFCVFVVVIEGFVKSDLSLMQALSSYPKAQLKARLGLYQASRREVMLHNTQRDRGYEMGVNKFSIMTAEERGQYLGIANATLEGQDTPLIMPDNLLSTYTVPDSVDHTELAHVTAVKDQERCGSCWSFAATGAFEGAYATVTGVTKSFSEKELLDCTYEAARPNKNGCKGGFYSYAFNYIKKGQRLATMKDAPYWPEDEACKWASKPNGIKNAELMKHVRVAKEDMAVEKASAVFVLAVAYTVEDSLFLYKSGIYDGCTVSTTRVDHGSVLVGYSKLWWKIKNSWGPKWGEAGFVRFTRAKANVCNMASHAMYPVVVYRDRGEEDEGDDGVIPDVLLVNVAGGSSVVVEPLVSGRAHWAVDTHLPTCFTTGSAANPHVALDLKAQYTIEKIVLTSTAAAADQLQGAKLYVGERGNFMDLRVAVLTVHDQGLYSVTVRSPITGGRIKASKIYLEYYNYGQTQRNLKLCDIQVLAMQDDTKI